MRSSSDRNDPKCLPSVSADPSRTSQIDSGSVHLRDRTNWRTERVAVSLTHHRIQWPALEHAVFPLAELHGEDLGTLAKPTKTSIWNRLGSHVATMLKDIVPWR